MIQLFFPAWMLRNAHDSAKRPVAGLHLMFFFANFYFNYQHDVHRELSSPDLLLLKSGIAGFMGGLIGTRSLKLYWTLRGLASRRLPVNAVANE